MIVALKLKHLSFLAALMIITFGAMLWNDAGPMPHITRAAAVLMVIWFVVGWGCRSVYADANKSREEGRFAGEASTPSHAP